ncbi:MAG: hypothetical protein OXI87_19640 [Albidovulum sp.]|nr:hypothetical protein [Albidovulum sp.]
MPTGFVDRRGQDRFGRSRLRTARIRSAVRDNAFEAEHGCWLAKKLEARDRVAVIPSISNGKVRRSRDREM